MHRDFQPERLNFGVCCAYERQRGYDQYTGAYWKTGGSDKMASNVDEFQEPLVIAAQQRNSEFACRKFSAQPMRAVTILDSSHASQDVVSIVSGLRRCQASSKSTLRWEGGNDTCL